MRKNVNFSYVENLSESSQRIACLYEYARHCPELIEIVLSARRAGVFSGPHEGELRGVAETRITRLPRQICASIS